MKIKKLIILILSVLFSFSIASAQNFVNLDAVTAGLHNTDTLNIDTVISFSFRLQSASVDPITGFTNGFRIYSPQGATWTTTTGAHSGAITVGVDSMMSSLFVNLNGVTGADSDTIGFGGFVIFETGILDGFNDTVWNINIGPLLAADHGKTICIDSAFYRPANSWLWPTDNDVLVPAWDGPHCFVIYDSLGTDPNNPPVLGAISDAALNEGSNLNFDVNATDADGNSTLTMSISTTTLPSGYNYTDNGNGNATFDWTPSSTDAGVYTTMFVASDGTDADSQLVTITVNNVSLPPTVSTTGPTTRLECQTFVLAITGSAGDDGTITLDTANAPAGSNFTDNGGGIGSFSWTATKGSVTDSVMIIATESPSALADSIVVVLTVTPNVLPVFVAEADISIGECDTISFNIAATDGNGETVTFTAEGANKGGFVDNRDNTLTYSWITINGDAGVYPETFYATDGCGDADTLIFNLTVNANASPVLSAIADTTIVECGSVTRAITVTDADGDPLTITVGGLPTGATFADNGDGTADFSWTTASGDAGANPITVAVADDCGGVDTVVFNVTVTANAAPVIAAVADTTVNECDSVGFSLAATNAEAELMTYTAFGADVNSIFIDNGDGTADFSWNTASGDAGVDSVWFVVTDACGLIDSELVVITVIIDSLPQFAPQADTSLTQNDTMVIIVSATDPESGTITLTIDSASVPDPATEWTFVLTGTDSAIFTWNTTGNTNSGIHMINFFASDGCGTATLTVNFDIATTVELIEGSSLPEEFYLSQNYPNPFNPTTKIEFGIAEKSHVKVAVYNVLGQEIRVLVDEYKSAGSYYTWWDGKSNFGLSVSSGIYFYKLETLQYFETKKMILLK